MEMNSATTAGRRRGLGRSAHLFTLEQANRALPLVRRIVADIVKQHKHVCALEEQCHAPKPGDDGGFEALRRRYDAALDKLQQLADELSAIGCVLGDSRRGIVDFRTLYQGREVELCWRLGDEGIEYWHELVAGMHGRQAIDPEFLAEVLQPEATA